MKQPTLLSTFAAFAGVLLFFGVLMALVHQWTGPRIAAYEKAQAQKAALAASASKVLQPLFPDATEFEKLGSTTFYDSTADYFAVKKEGVLVGYAIHAFGKGYQSVIHAVAGVAPDFSIKAVRVLHENETEGFGTRLHDEEFLAQFIGKRPDLLRVITEDDPPDSNAIVALTAATISSRAFAEDAVKTALQFLKKELGK